jgi:hypothetical protein
MQEPHQRESEGVVMNVKMDADIAQTEGKEEEMEVKHHA